MKTLNNTEFQELKQFISSNEIDPSFLNYGGFVYEIKPESYRKDYRNEVLPFVGMYKIFTDTNLYTLYPKDGHDLVLTEDQKNEILPIIKERQTTDYFKDIFDTMYNCYGYEYTIYSDDFKHTDDWYISVEPENKHLLSLDASEKQNEELKELVTNQCLTRIEFLKEKHGIKINGYEVRKKYGLMNFTREEFLYIQKEIVSKTIGININNHPTHQITRRTKKDVQHRISDFKEYVLEPTKRKVLIHIYPYGVTYVEIDKLKEFH